MKKISNKSNLKDMTMKRIQIFALVMGLGFMVGCSDDEERSTVSGSAVKGYVGSANVNVYQYMENGVRGKLLASTVTDAKGNYSISTDYRGAVEVVVTDGSYKDEATGSVVALGKKELRSVVMLKGSTEVAVTALTTIAAEHADAHASAGLEIAITSANRAVARAFGLSSTTDVTAVIPADLSFPSKGHSSTQIKYGAIQAGFSQYVKEEGLTAAELLVLIEEMAVDFSDGRIDGKSEAGATLQVSLSVTPVQALAGLSVAIENFMASENNKSEVSGGFSFTFSGSAG